MKITDYFVSTSNDELIKSIIEVEFKRCKYIIDIFENSTEIVVANGCCEYNGLDRTNHYLLNDLGFEGFGKSWEEWYCGIISQNGSSPNRRIFPNGKSLSFSECMIILENFPRSHVKNTIVVMNKLQIVENNRSIEDIASAVIKLAVLTKLMNHFNDSNTLKTIEYHLCKLLQKK